MVKTKLNYQGYELSFPHEAPVAVAYIERCDPLPLSELIKSDIVLSQGMKDFVADVVTGKLRRKPGQRRTTEREDFEIFLLIRDFMDEGCCFERAIAKTADILYPYASSSRSKDETLKKAYDRINIKHFGGGK